IEATIRFAQAEKIPASAFEFQMLYGIRRDLQRQLVKRGWRMRVYIPFGTEWDPYFMRRLAERPANALFVARNLLKTYAFGTRHSAVSKTKYYRHACAVGFADDDV